ncbi:ECF transporter S component [Aeromicrobium terrae]|uniref:ECF transporter S component n=1 Tax=Aeromicrobium terrae TaxID=2498846 RepID=A0A5C8NG47_9ACTN|nr:ECF transporter S component [Aeromicrobium terrae]TXL57893.1 ECF transporter S component [Aeromicrobium terrae]
MRTARLVPVHARPALALALVSLVGLVAFGWPFVIEPGSALDTSHSGDAPYIFVILLPLLVAVVLSELTSGALDAKAVAMLGMLAAVGGALRALSPGTAGLEPSFAIIVLGGRVFGRGFGFVLGAVTVFAGALITGGVGPWLPFQMIAAGWVGFGAGCLGPVRGRGEVAVVAAYAAFISLAFGFLMNLWFWPFASYGPETSYVAGAGLATNVHHYLVFFVTTSLPWDLGRALLSLLLILVAGKPLLRALRRAGRRAAFDVPVAFERAVS